jgi:hypothetical protein
MVRPTGFHSLRNTELDKRKDFLSTYKDLVEDGRPCSLMWSGRSLPMPKVWSARAVQPKPSPFDGFRGMEVDLLCDNLRLVIELDGAQHLGDRAAYRRDRRKDQLLQENGYIVLRFLAEDVAKDLDAVLDAILRSIANRRQSLRLVRLRAEAIQDLHPRIPLTRPPSRYELGSRPRMGFEQPFFELVS